MSLPVPHVILLRMTDWAQMQTAAAAQAPNEACGLLAGLMEAGAYRVEQVIPMTNALHSPVRYRIDPAEQLQAFIRIEESGLELVGIYHSHPKGPAGPSETDLAEAYYPEAVYLIWNAANYVWECRAFSLRDGRIQTVEISLLPS